MATRTITLTGRPPVRISDDNWPEIASASYDTCDTSHTFQANRKWNYFLKVRRHADGRAIVYAGYDHETNWQDEHNASDRQGDLLTPGCTDQDICDTIKRVAARMTGDDSDSDRWDVLARECIADMPAEQLD